MEYLNKVKAWNKAVCIDVNKALTNTISLFEIQVRILISSF